MHQLVGSSRLNLSGPTSAFPFPKRPPFRQTVSAYNFDNAVGSHARRTANYKPNIWNYESLLSLTSKYGEVKYKRESEIMKEEVAAILCSSGQDPLNKLELIDGINKLALSYCFEEEINEAMNEFIACKNSFASSMNYDLYSAALFFRTLRQYGHNVSQDALVHLMDEEKKFMAISRLDDKTKSEVFEACHLAMEGEFLLDRAKLYTTTCLRGTIRSDVDESAGDINIYSPQAQDPLHWGVSYFNVKKHIHPNNNSALLPLARLSFNIVQVQHQKDLKEIIRWWKNLGLSENLTFVRDRVVESFLWAVGVAYEPHHGNLRKWLTKAIVFILIIDDVYDIYGSMQELEQFTIAVESWDPREIDGLPEAMKRCFWALYDTVHDIDSEIQKEKGWNSVLPHIRNVWTEFCKSLLVEAKWHHTGRTPSLQEYLDNGWISSSGAVLSLHVLFGVGKDLTETINTFNSNQDIIHHASLIIRLRNDEATLKAELQRGDAPSSILCYMKEANVEEGDARDYVRKTITCSWKKMNGLFISSPQSQQPIIRYILNIARVANFFYRNGDGFGVQGRDTRQQVLSCVIEPLPVV
uniref:Putative terpene synthase 11 n=1 Tax=Eremophila drummondii TaxID=2652523 RepID=A0A6G9KSR8_9LAMI|nr:putative terpene synthase 11 [Eremophila drummondii]